MKRGTKPRTLAARIAEFTVRTASGCLEFTGKPNEQGYGRITYEGRLQYLHRLVWESAHGPLAEGRCVLHKCDNPPCCELSHLFEGTRLDNVRDMNSKGRANHARGQQSATSKLTEADVRYLRAIPKEAYERHVEAARFGMHPRTLDLARSGKSWAHI